MPNSALTLFDATLSLYPAGDDGAPALDLPLWLGACAERLRLTDEFISVETRPTGRRYPKHHPLVLTHQIDINRVWVSEQQAESFRVFAAGGRRYVLDILWEEEGSTRWFRRTYYGVTLRSDSYESNDLNGTAGHFMEDQSFTAEYFIEDSGVGEVDSIEASLPLYVQWVGLDGTFPLYNFAGGDFFPVSEGITDDRMAIGSGSLHFAFDEEDPAMSLIDGDASVTTGFFETAPGLSSLPRVEFMRGNQRLASLDSDGRFFAPNINVGADPVEDDDAAFTLYSDAAKTVPVMSIAATVTIIASILSLTVTPDGVASDKGIGLPTVKMIVRPASLPNLKVIGAPVLNGAARPAAVPAVTSFGNVYVYSPVAPTGVASSLSIGTAQVKLQALPDGVESAAGAIGSPTVKLRVNPDSLTSSLVIGAVRAAGRPASLASHFSAGSPTVTNLTLNPASVPSSFSAGLPTVSVASTSEDMPLNSAAYEPGRDKIYAVRDGYVFKLNASTGAKEASAKFCEPGLPSDSYIAYDTTTDKLWATYWRNTSDENAAPDDHKYLAEIDPDDLSVILHDWKGSPFDDVSSNSFYWYEGPTQIICVSGIAYVLRVKGTGGYRNDVCRIDLSVPAVTHEGGAGAGHVSWGNIHYDGTSILQGGNGDVHVQLLAAADLSFGDTTGGVTDKYPYGVTRDPTNGHAYFACGTRYIVRAEVGGGHTSSTIDTGRANAAPHNIRYNSNNLKIYIPCLGDNTVIVLDPTDDSMVVKTGFDNPFDVVFTATKAFAVQHGAVGLLEIT